MHAGEKPHGPSPSAAPPKCHLPALVLHQSITWWWCQHQRMPSCRPVRRRRRRGHLRRALLFLYRFVYNARSCAGSHSVQKSGHSVDADLVGGGLWRARQDSVWKKALLIAHGRQRKQAYRKICAEISKKWKLLLWYSRNWRILHWGTNSVLAAT